MVRWRQSFSPSFDLLFLHGLICVLPMTGGTELQDSGGIARTGGLASKVQKCATAPVKQSGIAEGAVWSQAVLFFQFLPFYMADLRFTTFIQFRYRMVSKSNY